jgi:hypothetical protein
MLNQAAAAIGVDSNSLLQYGAIGIIAILALSAVRVLFQREVTAHDLERQRADRLEDELRRLNATIQDRYISTLTESSRVMSEVLDYLRRGENPR